jgi:hypothetical protein
MSKKDFKFKLNVNNLKNLIDILKDLSRIDQVVKMKIDSEEVLFYSRKGVGHNIHAFKSFILPIDKFLECHGDAHELDFIITNCKSFISNLSIFLKKDEINCKLKYNEGQITADTLTLNDGALKLNFISGDYREIKDISKYDIRTKMDVSLANFSFDLEFSKLEEIQKLSKLNNSEVTNIVVNDGKIIFSEPRWKYGITVLDNVEDRTYTFQSKYLKSITNKKDVVVYVFDQFLLLSENDITLMIGFELDAL